eukprot:1143617-Pelagomonas_calceolata.AAC.7
MGSRGCRVIASMQAVCKHAFNRCAQTWVGRLHATRQRENWVSIAGVTSQHFTNGNLRQVNTKGVRGGNKSKCM